MTTLIEAMLAQAATNPHRPAWHAHRDGRWDTCTWRQHIDLIRRAARGLGHDE